MLALRRRSEMSLCEITVQSACVAVLAGPWTLRYLVRMNGSRIFVNEWATTLRSQGVRSLVLGLTLLAKLVDVDY